MLIAVVACAGTLLFGCATKQPVVVTQTGEIIVPKAPPAPKHETQGTAPSAAHVWVPGYWASVNNRWVWVPGQWELRPRDNVVWVPGRWESTSRGYVWTPGHWR